MTSNGSFAQFKTTHGASIHRIPLEVFPGFWAYVYLVEHNELRVLIDCGSATETSHANLLDGLSQAGSQPQDLTHILLTHAHIDHYGGLAKLRLLTSAKLGVHELDVQTVSHHQARLAQMSRRLASFLADTGLAEETREQLLSIYRMTKAFHHSVPVDFTYEAENMHLGEFEFVHLPGHCPGHIAIRLHEVVFCGDMVVAGVTPHLTPESIMAYSGLDHYLQSLDRFQEWGREARVVLNGHDDVITDLPGAISAILPCIKTLCGG
jgi:glyoxylase-like metal-dependent hydrolase (beta-lactamase superfamily II)